MFPNPLSKMRNGLHSTNHNMFRSISHTPSPPWTCECDIANHWTWKATSHPWNTTCHNQTSSDWTESSNSYTCDIIIIRSHLSLARCLGETSSFQIKTPCTVMLLTCKKTSDIAGTGTLTWLVDNIKLLMAHVNMRPKLVHKVFTKKTFKKMHHYMVGYYIQPTNS